METDSAGAIPAIPPIYYCKPPDPSGVAVTVSGNPFTWQNTSTQVRIVRMTGGTALVVSIDRDGSGFVTLNLVNSEVILGPIHSIRVAYVTAPTVTIFPL